ncbi:MAG: ABC transporter permease subunit [candidate division WOR-3 bacterium]|uniref:ABC transporter n=1 Tax=candidate division WOR-3 bacterium TaxID=2052148 RepID=A0A7V4E252_UNCW3
MKRVFAVYKKELKSYFNSPIGYIYLVVFLVLTQWLFLRNFFVFPQTTLRDLFSLFPIIFVLFIPGLTMRLWAEERKVNTIEILFTLPLKDYEILFGKFLSALTFFALSLLLTFLLPITLSFIGDLDWGATISGYIGALFLGGAYISLGLALSSFTQNQIVAYILSVTICFLFYIIGEDALIANFSTFWINIFKFFSLKTRFESITRGIIDLRDIIYYISFMGFFLYLNIWIMDRRR